MQKKLTESATDCSRFHSEGPVFQPAPSRAAEPSICSIFRVIGISKKPQKLRSNSAGFPQAWKSARLQASAIPVPTISAPPAPPSLPHQTSLIQLIHLSIILRALPVVQTARRCITRITRKWTAGSFFSHFKLCDLPGTATARCPNFPSRHSTLKAYICHISPLEEECADSSFRKNINRDLFERNHQKDV